MGLEIVPNRPKEEKIIGKVNNKRFSFVYKNI